MAKKILTHSPSWIIVCGDCGTKFSYELEDITRIYRGLPKQIVVCPNGKCGAQNAHFPTHY